MKIIILIVVCLLILTFTNTNTKKTDPINFQAQLLEIQNTLYLFSSANKAKCLKHNYVGMPKVIEIYSPISCDKINDKENIKNVINTSNVVMTCEDCAISYVYSFMKNEKEREININTILDQKYNNFTNLIK